MLSGFSTGNHSLDLVVVFLCSGLLLCAVDCGTFQRRLRNMARMRSTVSSRGKSKRLTKNAVGSSTPNNKSSSSSANKKKGGQTIEQRHMSRSLRKLDGKAKKTRHDVAPNATEDQFLIWDDDDKDRKKPSAKDGGGIASYLKKAVSGVMGTVVATNTSKHCNCAMRNDALDCLVNNPQFSDVTFIVGKGAPQDEEMKGGEQPKPEEASKSSSSTKKSRSSALTQAEASLSLDDDDDADPATSSKWSEVYAIRGILAASSDVFKGMFSGEMLESKAGTKIYVPDCSPRGFITMLRYLYTNRPDVVNEVNLVEAMYCAHKYQVDTLLLLCSQYIKEHLSIENVCRFLLDCEVWVSAAFMKFISVHADEILQSPEFSQLDKKKVMNIIESDALSVGEEIQVFDAVVEWGKAALKRKGVPFSKDALREEVADMVNLVRFPQMNLEELLGEVVETGLLTEKQVFSVIMYWQTGGKHPCEFNGAPRLQRYIDLRYERDWDENGVIFFIGTKGGSQSFHNPHNAPLGVTNKMSSRENGMESQLTSRSASQLYTNSVLNSTIGFDLGEERLLSPTHYTIRHGFASANYYPRNWVFEGSFDGSTWDILRRHVNDSKINAPQGSGSWEIEMSEVEAKAEAPGGGEPKYRHFRVRNTGMDHSSSNYLMVCGMEVYGRLYTKEKHGYHFRSKKKKAVGANGAANGNLFSRSGFGRR